MWDKAPLGCLGTAETGKKPGRMLSYRDAIREALETAMRDDSRVMLLGEGIDDPSGVFGTTTGLQKQFGVERVVDTPICENTLTGIAMGASLAGLRPVLIHMRADFLLMSMDQIVNHVAKWKYMFGGKLRVPLLIRAIVGGGWGSAAQHSQPLQALFAHTPGLKVVMPSTAYNAKGLILDALQGDAPVIMIEHRWLYDRRSVVPKPAYRVPIGKAAVVRQGSDVTLISDSFMSALTVECADVLAKEGIDTEIIDLVSIKPLDTECILRSVRKTKRALILDFGYLFCGISAEIASVLGEKAFGHLKAPVRRIGLPDAPTPASPVLEKQYYPTKEDIVCSVRQLMAKQRKPKR